ncbi:MAG: molybdopterin-guanine dinucleotide biosynthesis protein MobB [Halanaerobiales bacterium]|nr:molybdopterin-guanine dinucleotide biosynthesis protein MobB [Halanaerobiales bacterium]
MTNILVSSKRKGLGKTTLIEKIIKNLKGDIIVIKSSIHDKYDGFKLIEEKEIIEEDNTDTSIFNKAGAQKVYYLKSNKESLKEGMKNSLNNIKDYDYLLVEGNSIIEFINFNLIFYLDKRGGDKKDSAEMCKNRADVIINRDKEQKIEFNLDKISCFKAHVLGNSLGIPLKKVGKMLNDEDIRVNDCQLGLF